MILNFEISDELGAALDDIAKSEHRSRRAQATKLLEDAIGLIASDDLSQASSERLVSDGSGTNPDPSADRDLRKQRVVRVEDRPSQKSA